MNRYARQLDHLRDAPITLVEFCQNDDASLRAWRACLPRARVVGVFGDERFRSFAAGGIEIEIGSQSDRAFLRRLAETMRPHVVIDDGSHFWSEQLHSLEVVFPEMPPDGLYVIEALHTSFGDDMRATYGINDAANPFELLLRLARAVADRAPIAERPALSFCADLASEVVFLERAAMLRRKPAPLRAMRAVAAADVAAAIHVLDNGGSYRRGPARIVDAPGWLRDGWQAKADVVDVEPPPARVHMIPDAIVHARGVVEAATGELVAESLLNSDHAPDIGPMSRLGPERRLYLARETLIERRFAGSENCVLLKQTWDDNYGHWIVESLPRVALIEEVLPLQDCRFLVGHAPPAMRAVYLESLGALGIRPEQIVETSDHSFRAEMLIYPAPLTIQPWVKAPRAIATAERVGRTILGDEAPDGPRVLYVSRNRMAARRLRNEDAILDILGDRGVTVVHPETMSFAEQIHAFSAASLVVGPLGGALTNLAFSPKGVKVFALTTEFMQDDFFWDLIAHKGGAYVSLHGVATDPGFGMQSDFVVDPAKFRELLEGMP